MAAPRRTITPEFRKRMLRDAAMIFGGLLVVLFILANSVPSKVFLITALLLVPASALVFNFQTRRLYAAQRRGKP